ncbi:MAG: RHS repeat-associated core domain-containing protein [Pseudomonadota bacterium]
MHLFTLLRSSALLVIVLLLSSPIVVADDPGGDGTVIEDILLPEPRLGHFPGENIELASLKLSYDFEDVRIPGPNGLDIVVGRKYRQAGSKTVTHLAGFGDNFEFKVPFIAVAEDVPNGNTVPQTGYECVIDASRFGIRFYMPDQTLTTVGLANESQLPAGTLMAFSNHSVFLCENGLPVVRSAEGIRYVYGKKRDTSESGREAATHYLTRMEDRFGNAIDYHYAADLTEPYAVAQLAAISRSDGALVEFTYQSHSSINTISTITYGDRQLTYAYVDPGAQSNYTLDKVFDEEGRVTDFNYYSVHGWLESIEFPSGARAEYTYQVINPDQGLNGQVRWKTLSGPDMPTRHFTYHYQPQSAFYLHHADVFETETDALDGDIIDKVFTIKNQPAGHPFTANEQALHTVTNGTVRQFLILHGGTPQIGGGNLIYSLYNEWVPHRAGGVGCQKHTQAFLRYRVCARPRLTKQIRKVFNGIGNTENTFTAHTLSFDAYGFPTKTRYWANYDDWGGGSKYVRKTYLHDPTNWLIGLERATSLSSTDSHYTETFRRDYYSPTHAYKSLPQFDVEFGRWVVNYQSYHPSGEARDIRYNQSDRVERRLQYKRGQPQEYQLPNTNSTVGGMVSRFAHVDDFGNVIHDIDFRGNEVVYAYDKLNRLTHTDYGGATWNDESTVYDDTQNLEVTTIGNLTRQRYFDGLGRTTMTRSEETGDSSVRVTVRRQYTKQGQLAFLSFPDHTEAADGTRYTYDALGRKIEEWDTTTNSTRTWAYLSGHRVRYLDGLGNETVTTYEAYGTPQYRLPVQIRQAVSLDSGGPDIDYCGDPPVPCRSSNDSTYIETRLSYDQFGNVRSVMQADRLIEYRYDNHQKLCRISRPDVGDTTMAYSAQNQLLWSVEGASGSSNTCGSESDVGRIQYVYDAQGRLHYRLGANPYFIELYGRDANNNVLGTLATDGIARSYFYNDRNQPILEYHLDTGSLFRWLYNANGDLSAMVYPNGTVINYAPDALGRPTQAGELITSIDYHPTGQPAAMTYGNGYQRTIEHAPSGRIERITDVTPNGSLQFRHTYQYDKENNLKGIADGVEPAYNLSAFSYDGLGRLTGVRGVWGNSTFDYDDTGNLTRRVLGAQITHYQYNSKSQLLGVNGHVNKSFAYDGRGNVIHNGTRSFSYDRRNRLVSSAGDRFSYDAQGLRASKTTGITTSHYGYSLGGVLYRSTDTDGRATDYYYIDGNLIAERRVESDAVEYIHTDRLGSVSLRSDQDGQIVKRTHFQPFGQMLMSSNDDETGYTGHRHDSTLDLVYMKARYYDASIGRFYSSDPVGFRKSNTALFNRYAYANNNPYKFVDLMGEESYLVSRPINDPIVGQIANHNFVVSHASFPGDPNAFVYSFGKLASGVTGQVTDTTTGFSAGTYATDREAWLALASQSERAVARSATRIKAGDDRVQSLAESVVLDTWYDPLPQFTRNKTNSNTVASAVADTAQGSKVALPDNNRVSPGHNQTDRIRFEGKQLRGGRLYRIDRYNL